MQKLLTKRKTYVHFFVLQSQRKLSISIAHAHPHGLSLCRSRIKEPHGKAHEKNDPGGILPEELRLTGQDSHTDSSTGAQELAGFCKRVALNLTGSSHFPFKQRL